MDESEEKNRDTRSRPLEGLASPFLEAELFAGESEEEWETRLAALEAETPFALGLEQGAGLVYAPEVEEAEEPSPEVEAPYTDEELEDYEEEGVEEFEWEDEETPDELEWTYEDYQDEELEKVEEEFDTFEEESSEEEEAEPYESEDSMAFSHEKALDLEEGAYRVEEATYTNEAPVLGEQYFTEPGEEEGPKDPILQYITHAGPYRLAYDRLRSLGVIQPLPGRDRRRFRGTTALKRALDNWAPFIELVTSPPNYILTGGLYVNKPGEHGKGNAIDVDGFWWSDTNKFLAIDAPTHWVRYLTIEATLRKEFGTVLNYDWNRAHHDHWHCDLGRPTTWRAVRSQVNFAQRALNEIWGEGLKVDGEWGSLSRTAAIRHGYDFATDGRWTRFLDDIIGRQQVVGSVVSSPRPAATPGPQADSDAAKPAAELVRFAQWVLNATEGERLVVDGILGRLTRGTLERFRRRYNLGAGGVLDDTTQLALAQRALEEIRQQSLFPRFGVLDAATREVLVNFKSERGLGANATLNAATRAGLVDALAQRVSVPRAPPAGGGE